MAESPHWRPLYAHQADRLLSTNGSTLPVIRAFLASLRGQLNLGQLQLDEAVFELDRAAILYRELYITPLDKANAYWALARALARRGDSARAQSLASEAMTIYITIGESTIGVRNTINRWRRRLPVDNRPTTNPNQ